MPNPLHGVKAGISHFPSVWVDIDGDPIEAEKRLRSFALAPSIIVTSGHGAHGY